MKQLAIAILVLSFQLAACGAAPDKPTPTPTMTPLQSFEQIVASLPEPTFRLVIGPRVIGICDTFDRTSEFSYDVNTTTSLVSPYTGTISFDVGLSAAKPPFGTVVLDYAYQDNAWVFKSAHSDPSGLLVDCDVTP